MLTPGGDIVKEANGAFPRVILAEGDYRAIARNENRTYERAFKVVTGIDGEAEVLAVAYPKLKDTVPAQFADVESKPFYRAVNTVDLGQFIRIKADEATYNLILYCASNWNSKTPFSNAAFAMATTSLSYRCGVNGLGREPIKIYRADSLSGPLCDDIGPNSASQRNDAMCHQRTNAGRTAAFPVQTGGEIARKTSLKMPDCT